MSTYSLALVAAATATSCCSSGIRSAHGVLFRVNLKQACVQSLNKRHSSFTSSSTFTGNRPATADRFAKANLGVGGSMLNNIHCKPFHSSTYQFYDANMRTDSRGSGEIASGDVIVGKYGKASNATELANTERKDGDDKRFLMSSSELDDLDSDYVDDEEINKQNIWAVGEPALAPTFNFAAYANDSEIIKKLVHLGVDLSKLEKKNDVLPYILKLDFEKHVAPCVRFLCDNGINPDMLGWYLTKNPYLLREDLRNLDKRLDYLRLKKFSPEGILRIITANPHWLLYSVTRIDGRLGFFQSFFSLNGSQVRKLAESGPKVITSSLRRVKSVTFTVKEEMGFNREEIISLLVERPRIWREESLSLWRRFDYIHNEVKISHEDIVRCPDLLLVREEKLKNRIGFLKHIGKAQFDPDKPNYVTYKMMYSGDDAEFATKVAKSSVLEYNDYLKSL